MGKYNTIKPKACNGEKDLSHILVLDATRELLLKTMKWKLTMNFL
jgi:hypothetical protein